jgi:hypothetical protein
LKPGVVGLDKQPPKPIPERNFPYSARDVSSGHELVRRINERGGLAYVEWPFESEARKAMGRKWNERLDGKRWLDRAEVMLALAATVHDETGAQIEETRALMEETKAQMEETKAQMEQLAANWRCLAALERERQRSAGDETRSAD